MSSITRVLTPVIIFIQWLVYAEVYLPIEGGSVVMEFDGQKQRLTVDTGSQVLFVVYKEWYEETYIGKSCAALPSGCYSCPNDCGLHRAARKFSVGFSDKTEVIFVMHEGTIKVGDRVLHKATFGLIIGFNAASPDEEPHGLVGLGQSYHPGAVQSFVFQLYEARIINEKSFSVCTPGKGTHLDGILTLGGRGSCEVGAMKSIKLMQPVLPIAPYQVRLGRISVATENSMFIEVHNSPAILDTGDALIRLPAKHFTKFIRMLERTGDSPGSYEGLVHNTRLKDMPIIQFDLGDEGAEACLVLPPADYTEAYSSLWRMLSIEPTDSDTVSLGMPFFRMYYTYFNLHNSTVEVGQYRSQRQRSTSARTPKYVQNTFEKLNSSLLP